MGFLSILKRLFESDRVDLATHFEMLREAVSGTMSSFHKARDLETGKIVGLKILDPLKVDPIENRYKGLSKPSEGEIGSRITGPHVARTIRSGIATTQRAFIVFEFIDGTDLHSVLSSGTQLPPPKRLDLVRQAAMGIESVHNAGFVHRDICPRNFILAHDGRLVLIDFGLTVPDKPEFLRPGNRVGTPNYMSPEVIRRRPIDKRLDIFSFGVTAFEICTLHTPWPRGSSGLSALAHDSPPHDIRTLWPDIPEALAQSIMLCLSSEPQDRPESMGKVLTMLEKVTL